MELTYKGYTGQMEWDEEEKQFYGEIVNLQGKDVVTFVGQTENEAEKSFHDSVDDYLEFCKSRGEFPGNSR